MPLCPYSCPPIALIEFVTTLVDRLIAHMVHEYSNLDRDSLNSMTGLDSPTWLGILPHCLNVLHGFVLTNLVESNIRVFDLFARTGFTNMIGNCICAYITFRESDSPTWLGIIFANSLLLRARLTNMVGNHIRNFITVAG